MAIKAKDIDTLHRYAQGMMERSSHHAKNVSVIALTLLGGVIWKAEPGSIEIRTYNGNLANMVWWKSASSHKTYSISYNHDTQEIDIREGSIKDTTLFSFTDKTDPSSLLNILSSL
ncbi:hypothetical protein [Serratia marcescens]|uniref:hypothetical protein n=1 Tax=Serratia marcescens TaxID=615 RepID=UPI0021BDEA64|nr:hypothetical protein [Serratia marcescens]MDW7733896.1 hypothetical protein [Serratia marcescens]MEE4610524.1 hypothetical protein [Serratia marcescens]